MDRERPDPVASPRSGEELREEFRAAQRRRLARGVVVWRDAELPQQGPPKWAETPPPDKVD